METSSLVLMHSCMLGCVSCSASVNMACVVLWIRVMRSTVSASFCMHDGGICTKRSVVFVVEVVFLCLRFQNTLVLIWIALVLTRPLILASLEMTSCGAELYVMCVSMTSSGRALLLTLVVWASHIQ